MYKKPVFISPRNFRNYEDFAFDSARAQGWNDAMHFIFTEELDAEKESQAAKLREEFYLITTAIEAEGE